MLDLKFMRENKEQVEKWLKQRGSDLTLDEFAKLDEERREILGEVEALKNKRNSESAEIARLKKAKEDASELIKAMGCLLYTSPSPRDRTRSRMPSSA